MRLPPRPAIYEINTAVWLERIGRERGGPAALHEVPGSEWDRLAALPLDAVWLMGVWERSPAGRAAALAEPWLLDAYRAALPDFRADDVIGSPYCIRDYVVDPRFGGPEALAGARRELADRGLALILDFVPNHVAADHPWVAERPDYFLHGSDGDLEREPEMFARTPAAVLAKGRDPYNPPWQDVLQLNAYSAAMRAAAIETLAAIACQCDGVRCDMAMLLMNDVFSRTWGERGGPAPEEDYWPAMIGAVRAAHPDFAFIAEAYWDLEWELQRQGFDYCYDKVLYDRLAAGGAEPVRAHLRADVGYQDGLVRFIENHDEPRAASTFGDARGRAAAVAYSTLPGARLYHDGQLEGRRRRIPVQLGRGPEEPVDVDLRSFYERLLADVGAADLRHARWQLCEGGGEVVAWAWESAAGRRLVVVNLSAEAVAARVRLPGEAAELEVALAGWDWRLFADFAGA